MEQFSGAQRVGKQRGVLFQKKKEFDIISRSLVGYARGGEEEEDY